ncbi:plasmid partitioning protein RepB C-terminal domain-containing protein [Sphingorhabdus sp. EL138]|uniref:plasmid partitioning protein RepB C-terminal domain-containing protein n=1 Tax=Sphingorhabdus sp. EL138 TaxID=2073156 RepID=UPI000D698299|nr:plasmid partitioning protein RepB C-terminal domain-containing protein [Sphingorhabdus sp. EL138]
MTKKDTPSCIDQVFEESTLRIPVADIFPLREVGDGIRASKKFAQIAASIREIGMIEPPVVYRDKEDPGTFHLLDGHIRLAVMKDIGAKDIVCLIATEDEAFTYNKRVNRLALVQEHKMILRAVKKGVPEERLARALNVNIRAIRAKRNLLVGICKEVSELLRDKHVPHNSFKELKKLKPMRQIEAAQLMIAMNTYSLPYARSLVAATPQDQLVSNKPKQTKGLSGEQIALMEKESENLDRDFRSIEKSYAADHLNLVLAVGYVGRLLESANIVRYLAEHNPDILSEFQSITALRKTS